MITVLVLIHAWAHAQSGTISGLVLDLQLRQPLAGATVQTASGRLTASDELGRFRIAGLQPGEDRLFISSVGFRTDTVLVTVSPGRNSWKQVALQSESVQLSQVLVGALSASPADNALRIDLRLRPANTGQDLLRIVPGLFIAQHAGGGKAEQLFLRGYDVDHGTDVAVSVDGLPVNLPSHAHGQGYADAHFLIPETVGRVDFEKGPYTADKGDFAAAGWVDFQTKDFLLENTVKAEGGSFGYRRSSALVRLLDRASTTARQQCYIASEYFATDGYFDASQDFHRFNLFGKYTLLTGNNARLQVSASAFDSRWNASGQIPLRAVASGRIGRFGSIDDSEGGATARSNVNLRFTRQWKGNWRSSDQLYFSACRFNLYSNFTFYLNDPQHGDGIQQQESRRLYGYNGRTARDYFIGDLKWSTALGYGFRYDDVYNLALNSVERRELIAPCVQGNVAEGSAYLFLQQQASLSRRVHLTAALRYERFRFACRDGLAAKDAAQRASVLLPKLRLDVQAGQRLSLYLSSGTGFHSNDARLVLAGGVPAQLPRVLGADMGMVYKPGRQVLLKAAFWWLDAEQEFVYVGDEGVVEPSGSARRVGFDLSARARLLPWLFADMDLNLARPRYRTARKGADYVPLAPTVTSAGGLTLKPTRGLSGSLRYRYLADRAADEKNSQRALGYLLADAVLSYRKGHWELQLTAENLLNTDWREAQFNTESRLPWDADAVTEIHFTPGTPRFLKCGLSYNF